MIDSDMLALLASPARPNGNGPIVVPELSVPPAKTPVKTPWQLVCGQNNVGPTYELANAKSISLNWHVDDSGFLQFNIDGNDPAVQYIQELVTDIWMYKNGILIDRFRVGSATDTLDGEADTYDLQINAFNYREWLKRQLLQPSHVWSWRNKTQTQIINDLYNIVIAGQSGIHPTFTIDTSKMPTSTVNFDTTPGTSVNEVIGVMSGFGWQVFPNSTMGLTLRAVASFYYNLNPNFVLQYGSTVSKVQRSYDTASYGNSSVFTGDTSLTPIQSDATGIATMPQGRLGTTGSDSNIKDTAHLSKAAADDATRSQSVVPTWQCTIALGAWTSPSDAWIGDICKFICQKGTRININDQYRITDLSIAVNEDSTVADGVDITVAKPPYIPSS